MNPKAIRPVWVLTLALIFSILFACRPARVIYVEREQPKVVVVKEAPQVVVVKDAGPVMPGLRKRRSARKRSGCN